MNATTTVRSPAVAGLFYPADPTSLHRQIDDLLGQVNNGTWKGHLVALVSPHAGYTYSGFTAAHAYKLLEGHQFDSIIIVSPSHREYFDGISVYGGSAYRTPLGDVAIDAELRDALVHDDELIVMSDAGHRQEHAVEVQIPFLQRVLKNCTIVPIVMGDQRREYCFHLGKKIAKVVSEKKVLLIASTDLSHYYPYELAVTLDRIVIDEVRELDYDQLMTDLEAERAEACGGGPIVSVLLAACGLGADTATILHTCNSGDVTGDRSGVVGYLSAAIFRTRE